MAGIDPKMADYIRASAERLGISPSDLATAISYESAGSFDPQKRGPVTQWGRHIGLIQAGEPQRKKYGIDPAGPLADQFAGIERYLADAGVKPGHGLLDVYSAINSGRVGRYDASDANNGGAPGTVRDKVANQMVGHRLRAEALLGGRAMPASPSAPAVAPGTIPGTGGVPFSLAPPTEAGAAGGLDATTLAALQQIAKLAEDDGGVQVAPQPINYYRPGGVPRALSRAMSRAG